MVSFFFFVGMVTFSYLETRWRSGIGTGIRSTFPKPQPHVTHTHTHTLWAFLSWYKLLFHSALLSFPLGGARVCVVCIHVCVCVFTQGLIVKRFL